MTTKPPAAIQEATADSLEKIAYFSVASIPTIEPNDRNRLGYHIWRLLADKEGTIATVIRESGARLRIAEAEAAKIIRDELAKKGITLEG